MWVPMLMGIAGMGAAILIAAPILWMVERLTGRRKGRREMAHTCIFGGRECDGCTYCNGARAGLGDMDYSKLMEELKLETYHGKYGGPTPKRCPNGYERQEEWYE